MKKIIPVCIVLGGFSALSVAGCGSGGGNHSPATPTASTVTAATSGGRATISLRWPDSAVPTATSRAGRLVPTASFSVSVSFLDANGAVLQTALLVRPVNGGTVSASTFSNLPPGNLTVQATAFPNPDGTGVAQASVSGQALIVQNQLTPVSLTMNSTITRVEILPVIVQFTGNGATTLNAAAYDASGNLVLTNQWKWENSDPNIIALVPKGATADITALNVGQTTVTLTETESGSLATKVLDVTSTPIDQ